MAKFVNRFKFYFLIIHIGFIATLFADLVDDFGDIKSKPTNNNTSKQYGGEIENDAKSNLDSNNFSDNQLNPTDFVIDSSSSSTKAKSNVRGSKFKECKVFFKSKGIKGAKVKGMVELQEDVVIKKCDLELRSQRAIIFFDEDTNQVLKVEATGKIKVINFNDETGLNLSASGDTLVFDNKAQTLDLKGQNGRLAKMTRGDSLFTGKKITYNIIEDLISSDNIEGVLNPNQGVLP